MKKLNNQDYVYSFMLIPIFIWIGFVCSISFMEAWLKFQAPNVTLPIGLGIGRLVFAALNKVEWVLAALIILISSFKWKQGFKKSFFYVFIPVLILALQTMFLLPVLYEREELVMQGMPLPPSSVHFSYLFLEVVKVITLILVGVSVIFYVNSRMKESAR